MPTVKYLCGYYVVMENGRESHYRADLIDGMNGEITGKIARLEQQLRDLESIADYRRSVAESTRRNRWGD